MSRLVPNFKKNNFSRNLKNFKILDIRAFLNNYPLIIYLRYTGGSSNVISILRNYSLIHNFKVFMLNSKQLSGFMPDNLFFKFLTTGRSILLGFNSWEQLKFMLTLNFFNELKKFKVITISSHGYFFNLLDYNKLTVFDWLVDFCENQPTNQYIIYKNILIVIYILINYILITTSLIINNIKYI